MKNIFLIIALFSVSFVFCQNSSSLAESYFREGEYEKASQIYESLEKNNPFNTRYLKRLITCYQETSNYEKAADLLQKKLLNNPSQHYLRIEIGYNFDRQQKTALAKKEYDFAIDAITSDPSLGGIMGRMFQQNNLLDYAIEAYSKTMRLYKNASYEFQIAQIYGEKGEFEKMFDSYTQLIDKDENYLGGVQRFTSRYINEDATNSNNIAFKKSLLKKSISNPKNVWNELLSWLFTKQKEYGKAFIQEKALFNRDPAYIETVFRLAKIAFENNDITTAKKCFDFILEKTNFIEEKITAELYLLKIAVKTTAKNSASLFEKTLQEYGVNRNSLEIQLEFADYLTFKINNPSKAIEVLEKALLLSTSKFKNARIKLKLGEVLVFTGRFNKALLYFSQVQTQLKNHPLSQQARFKVAQTSYFKGDFKWAKSQLKILKGSTTQLIANDAVDLFLVISDNEPKDSIPSGLLDFAKADLLAYQNKNTEAIAIYSAMAQKYQGQNIEDDVLFNQATLYLKENQYENTISNLLKIISINAEGILVDDSYYLLAEVYKNKIKDTEKASEYYQKIIFEKPSSIYLVDARKKYREIRGDIIN
ncbi:tetratricopeptide repeat protein [Flavobacteriaceae bacterium]|nr:tetratricopeptide repeat protein [Flavobacteriaceae bacterium]MDB4252313.1 tetratricopeptide repeat protein [Flavobacteriaceae bacterium]MDB9928357.1 tetratricopeptide repeat protein [Flavobacteriaceae bacterium]MDB9956105.1 tetratricopeptide repeat protein [Flavobacteriaceae bacterium]